MKFNKVLKSRKGIVNLGLALGFSNVVAHLLRVVCHFLFIEKFQKHKDESLELRTYKEF